MKRNGIRVLSRKINKCNGTIIVHSCKVRLSSSSDLKARNNVPNLSMERVPMNISGKRIRHIRKGLNLKQVDVAAALNVDFGIEIDRSDISEIERGVRGVKDFELDAMARFFDVSPELLLRDD